MKKNIIGAMFGAETQKEVEKVKTKAKPMYVEIPSDREAAFAADRECENSEQVYGFKHCFDWLASRAMPMKDEASLNRQDAHYEILLQAERARSEKAMEHLKLALSFAPKGPVPEGLFATSYHTLNYADECKLQERVDAARSFLATYEQGAKPTEGNE